MSSLTLKKCKKIKELIQEFRDFKLVSPSSDPDEKTSVIYSYKALVKNIFYFKDYIGAVFLKNKMDEINLDFNDIHSVYEVHAEITPIIDDLEEYIKKVEKRLKNNKDIEEPNLSNLKRLEIISDIAITLQQKMTTTKINVFLGGYGLDFDKKEVADSKRVYVEEILFNVKEEIIIDIAKELDIKIIEINDVKAEKISELNSNYINDQIKKCKSKLQTEDYDGAITNARSLVESVCYYILDDSNTEFSEDGNLIKLYKRVSEVLKMDPSIYNEDFLKQISSGFFTIINGLASLRNELSDAHGKSERKSYKPDYRHAILAVNSAKTISEFLYSSWESREL